MAIRLDVRVGALAPEVKDQVEDYYRNLTPSTSGSAGADLVNPFDAILWPVSFHKEAVPGVIAPESNTRYSYSFGISAAMYEDGRRISYMLVPRSSFGKCGLHMGNSIGIIDSDYNGILQANIYNIGNTGYRIMPGTRLFQIIHPALRTINEIRLVDSLPETSRGEGGFGSTGK